MQRVLVTGGAGFIGSHLIDALLARGCEVMAFDNLTKQVHPLSPGWPKYTVKDEDGDDRPWLEQRGLHPWFGDVRDQQAVLTALLKFQPDTVVHLAALVGVGQSNEKIANYVSANVTGTAVLLNCIVDYNALVDDRAASLALLAEDVEVVPQVKPNEFEEIPRILGAGDVIAIGDEVQICEDGVWSDWLTVDAGDHVIGIQVGADAEPFRARRPSDMLKVPVMETQAEAEARYLAWRIETEGQVNQLPAAKVEQVFVAGSMSSYGEGAYLVDGELVRSPGRSGSEGLPVGLREEDALMPASVYASTKAEQERLALIVGETRGLDVRVGRFFNVYGERQAMSNPYTGVGAIFAARARAGLAPRVYEDGEQSRDFIHVSDLVSGILAILDRGAASEVYNIGTGLPVEIGWLAAEIARHFEAPAPEVTGQKRVGDIRHAYANASKLRALGWEPLVAPDRGVELLVEWAKGQDQEARDTLDAAHNDLLNAGLLGGGAA